MMFGKNSHLQIKKKLYQNEYKWCLDPSNEKNNPTSKYVIIALHAQHVTKLKYQNLYPSTIRGITIFLKLPFLLFLILEIVHTRIKYADEFIYSLWHAAVATSKVLCRFNLILSCYTVSRYRQEENWLYNVAV